MRFYSIKRKEMAKQVIGSARMGVGVAVKVMGPEVNSGPGWEQDWQLWDENGRDGNGIGVGLTYLFVQNTNLLYLHIFMLDTNITVSLAGLRSIAMSLSVCLSVTKFLCMLPVADGWSFSGSIAIFYVLPVFWMTSCLHIMACGMSCIHKQW